MGKPVQKVKFNPGDYVVLVYTPPGDSEWSLEVVVSKKEYTAETQGWCPPNAVPTRTFAGSIFPLGFLGFIVSDELRHATPEEIAEGIAKRITG